MVHWKRNLRESIESYMKELEAEYEAPSEYESDDPEHIKKVDDWDEAYNAAIESVLEQLDDILNNCEE